jgi:putative DNA primase/helicase
MKGDREMAEALRGIMNSGFDRAGARYILNVPVPGGYEPRQFSTWAPQLLSGIGSLPETVRDRAIEIEIVRKRPDETVRRLRRRDGGDLNVFCRKLARWAQDHLEKLRDANPTIPSGLDDRASDAWDPLLAIADLVGGDWPDRARRAAVELLGEHVKDDDEIGSVLLGDIRDLFEGRDQNIYVTKEGDKHLKSENLVAALSAREDRPWAEFGRARKPITVIGLARLLKGYKIRPVTVRFGPEDKDTAKGHPSHRHTRVKSRVSVRIEPSHRQRM